jgi:hypothetical protein
VAFAALRGRRAPDLAYANPPQELVVFAANDALVPPLVDLRPSAHAGDRRAWCTPPKLTGDLQTLGDVAGKTQGAFSTFGAKLVELNAGIELARKALEGVRLAYDTLIEPVSGRAAGTNAVTSRFRNTELARVIGALVTALDRMREQERRLRLDPRRGGALRRETARAEPAPPGPRAAAARGVDPRRLGGHNSRHPRSRAEQIQARDALVVIPADGNTLSHPSGGKATTGLPPTWPRTALTRM